MNPLVTVIMPVFNTEIYLAEAIKSILRQTYRNIEFIIINDGSTDGSLAIIKKFAVRDSRIRVISRKNMGLVTTLNEGVSLARGEYIARQDSDDISLNSRLEKQVRFLEDNPSVGLVGTNYCVIDGSGTIANCTNVLTHPDDIKLAEIFTNQFGHGTILAKTTLLSSLLYDDSYKHAEDYDLWTRISHDTKIANLSEPLYKWRLHEEGVTNRNVATMDTQVRRIRNREFNYFLKNREKFKLFSFHPSSINFGTRAYLEKKATLYRDMSLMYCYRDNRIQASTILLLALVHAPWVGRTYKNLFITVSIKPSIAKIEFEVI